LSSTETAAVLTLLGRRDLPWNRVAGMVEEAGSALRFVTELDDAAPGRLFEDDARRERGLDEMRTRVAGWESEGIHVVTVLDDAYPVNLRAVHDRPPVLFVRGRLEERDERSVAVVGTRSATERGLALAASVTRGVSDAGYVVVSGLAEGIDTAAHREALAANGRTIAVIGTGHRHFFPAQNGDLQRRLGDEAAVVSQFWPDQGARRWTFPQRNAVMSGIARATIVIEASHTSGARMQARLALEHGRPVFLMRSLLEHEWARGYAAQPGTHVVDEPAQIVHQLDRMYSDELTLAP
jgi:DNA processing protein